MNILTQFFESAKRKKKKKKKNLPTQKSISNKKYLFKAKAN